MTTSILDVVTFTHQQTSLANVKSIEKAVAQIFNDGERYTSKFTTFENRPVRSCWIKFSTDEKGVQQLVRQIKKENRTAKRLVYIYNLECEPAHDSTWSITAICAPRLAQPIPSHSE